MITGGTSKRGNLQSPFTSEFTIPYKIELILFHTPNLHNGPDLPSAFEDIKSKNVIS